METHKPLTLIITTLLKKIDSPKTKTDISIDFT